MGIDNWRRFLWGATAYPLVWLGLLYLLVLRTRIAVGHWPYYSHPDPLDTGFSIHYYGLLIGSVLIPALGLTATAFALWEKWRRRDTPWWLAVAPLAAAMFTILYLRIEPANIMDWFMD